MISPGTTGFLGRGINVGFRINVGAVMVLSCSVEVAASIESRRLPSERIEIAKARHWAVIAALEWGAVCCGGGESR